MNSITSNTDYYKDVITSEQYYYSYTDYYNNSITMTDYYNDRYSSVILVMPITSLIMVSR